MENAPAAPVPPDDATPFDAHSTNPVLLHQTQRYLESLLQRQAPDTMLTQAWAEFYRVYSNLIRRFVVAQGLRGADVEDCIQEVWSTVALKLADFQRPTERRGLRAWLYTVVHSKTADILRRQRRRAAESLDAAIDQGREPSAREPDPATIMDEQWQQAMLRTAVEELRGQVSERNYRVLQMRVFEDRSEADTAAELGLTPEQVRYRKHRMQQKLQAILAVYTGQDFG